MKKRVFLHSILLCCFLLSVFSLGAAAKNTDSSAGADDIDKSKRPVLMTQF